jgi:hypothetical protein
MKDLPLPLHHRTALLAALGKSIAEAGSSGGSSVDRAAATAALEVFVPHILAVINPDAELTGYQADAPLERGALRLAAADALLKVGSRLDKELPGQAFVEMGLVMQDELVEVCSSGDTCAKDVPFRSLFAGFKMCLIQWIIALCLLDALDQAN